MGAKDFVDLPINTKGIPRQPEPRMTTGNKLSTMLQSDAQLITFCMPLWDVFPMFNYTVWVCLVPTCVDSYFCFCLMVEWNPI